MKKHWLNILAALLTLAAPRTHAQSSAPAAPDGPIRVACVGASITYGAFINNREKNCYPAQMQNLLGEGYAVRNFGVNSRTMLKRGDFPYWNDPAYKQALAFAPNVVVLDLGGNDSKPQNWQYKDEFAADARAMIESFRALPSAPRVLLCLPMPAFKVMWGINDEVYMKEMIPMMREVAFETHTELLEMHSAFLNKEAWFADNIHPNSDGAALMAKIIGGVIAFKSDPAFDFAKNLAAQGTATKTSSFYGYRQLDFTMDDGRACIVVQPFVTAAGHPYAWRGEFFGHEPQTDLALLEHGYHVVYVGAQDMYGSPPAMKIWEKFHALLAKAGLDGKIALIGMSRGGLYCYNWAALHPETVSVLYGDAPVCDFKSWPGGHLRNSTSKTEWETLLKLYGFKDEAEAFAYQQNPVDNLEPLAKARIPIIHVVGQADTDVPVQDNTDVVEKRYQQLHGTIEVIRKPGAAHHPHSLPNPEPIVDFILSHQK
jgi:lysophospholipase L1-like esterase/pimeloyl-ACP methyl ester carboxylesterase